MNDCCQAKSITPTQRAATIALVGNPNCGKTTLFNALTGSTQRVGNWPGVTVERKIGSLVLGEAVAEVVDLPGVYSLTMANLSTAIDERIACEFVLSQPLDVIVNIVDGSQLERHLYLTTQLMELGVPIILAVNMMDVVKSRNQHLDLVALSQAFGCKVVALEAHRGNGLENLVQQIQECITCHCLPKPLVYPAPLQTAISTLAQSVPALHSANRAWTAIRLLENDAWVMNQMPAAILQTALETQQRINAQLQEDADILLADARYQFIQQHLQTCYQAATSEKVSWTERIDQVVLNRYLGLPIFFSIMYLLFVFAINVGGAFQDFFDITSQTLCVDALAYGLSALHAPTWLIALLAGGIGKGINTTITFIPVIGALFLFLSFLEDSGYMARAAFVVDRAMRFLGLPGKAFVPMIVGFGCNVPAVMAARTLENKRDRILTIMMAPFMSCGARLAIFAVFTTAFFPHGGQNVVFALYLIGIAMAVLTGLVLRTTQLRGDVAPLVMELPLYHWPRFNSLLHHAWSRLKGFVFRAGKLIVPICLLLGALNTLNVDGSLNTGDASTNSLLSVVGKSVTPLFAPMGIHADNWPATVGLVTGVLAKEVVVGTLDSLYSQLGALQVTGGGVAIWSNLQAAFQSIPDNLAGLGQAFTNPVLAQAPIHALNQSVYGMMYQKFDGQVGAFAYLLFVLLYFPCVSTVAAMLRELHRGWAIFSVAWMTGVAYGAAVFFYQAATWREHPFSSSCWLVGILASFALVVIIMRYLQFTKSKGVLQLSLESA